MSTQPNILVILTDQQTHAALSAHGNPHLHTPHMDSLVHSGLSFLNSYCPAPVCGPARGSLLNGRMPHETGVEVNGPAPTPEIPTMGEHFRRAGYRPFYAGKLHLGPRYRKGVQQVGGMQGFDFLCNEYPEKAFRVNWAAIPMRCGQIMLWSSCGDRSRERPGRKNPSCWSLRCTILTTSATG